MDLKDKVVFITGSSHGIGKQTAFKFAEENAKLVITYFRDNKAAKEVAEKCKKLGASDVLIVHLNLMDDHSVKEAVEEVIARYGEIFILINNAGVLKHAQFKDNNFRDIEVQIRTNVEGLFKITRQSLEHIKHGIINIASGAGKTAYPGLAVYCATKYAVRGFTDALAQENKDLKIHVVNPGMTKTRMSNFQGDSAKEVAQIIFDTAKGKYKKLEIDVWDHL